MILPMIGFCQGFGSENACSFSKSIDESLLCTKSRYSNKQIENLLSTVYPFISKRSYFGTKVYSMFQLLNCDGGGLAVTWKGDYRRYISYDNSFLSLKKHEMLTVLIHEIGHHAASHWNDKKLEQSSLLMDYVFKGISIPSWKYKSLCKSNHERELECDMYAGHIMKMMGYTLTEAQSVYYKISNNQDDTYSTHPKLTDRLNAVQKGYESTNWLTFW